MEDWALIRRLVADGVPQRQVARDLGVGRSTVARALTSDRPPKYERPAGSTSFTPFEPAVTQLLAKTPDMPATVIAERVGWTGSISWFRDNVRRLRPEHAPVDPADRLTWLAGDVAQCDLWFPPADVPLEDGTTPLLPVLVMTCAYSRFVLARMIPTRHTQDLLLGMWDLLSQLGAVPRRLIWDNESGIGRGKRHAEGVAAFAGTLATTLQRLKPYDPESKGVVERRNGYFETSFLPGREFNSPADFNNQLSDWLTIANARVVRTIKAKPADLLAADKAAMLALPPVPPTVGWTNRVRLGRDYYVRIDSNDYSVDPSVIGRLVDVHADLCKVRICRNGRLVAAHDRVWARGMTITDAAHVATAKILRQQYQQPRPAPEPPGQESLVRDLAEYDHAFGLTEDLTAVTGGEVA
ncbi:transposase [Rudaeicoccus suwonensis]|uniref:Transposase n=1 Tax=Rudaeicoccus suwonensis TaxID=657409 RepID=A0A561EC51_9MICO|nr:transposase [Rudaeicoccus suwonensis]TWE13184.1 transposase [Rudaeicoccus suwonensis]